ncbi:MAG: hypothetical protein GF418_16860, partial [Chitinivibrionales bacterium]|nr:hypothetical protein [Chitinivibrionales bacterium]MBD3397292.1 hypothetical protein [Chitinivibrionales bacterium]
MYQRLRLIASGHALFFLCAILCTATFAQQYTTQSSIDSTIQMAFFSFHEAQQVPGADFQMKRAIADAKDVVVRMKRAARGNINEKYILWK